MRVSTVENTIAWVLGDRVAMWDHVTVRTSGVVLGTEMTRLLGTVRGTIRAVLLTAEDLGLLLGDEGSSTVELLLLALLRLGDDVLLLLVELCRFHLISI